MIKGGGLGAFPFFNYLKKMKNIATTLVTLLLLAGNTFAQTDSLFNWARTNNISKLQAYADKGGNLDLQDAKGYTPLILAAYNGNTETVEWLLKYKVNPDLQDAMGNTALMGVCFKGSTPMAETLLKHGANPNVLNGNNANALFFATTFGHTAIVKLLLQYNVNTQQVDRMGKTALDYAIGQDNTEIISLLGK